MSFKAFAISSLVALTVGLTPGFAAAQVKSVPSSIKGDSTGVYRIWGSDRVSTAIFASRDLYPSADAKKPANKPKQQATHVIIAGADHPADSATAIPLAVQTGAPILLTYANMSVRPNNAPLHAYTRAEIQRVLRPGGMVTIVGGVDAVSLEAEDQLKKLTDGKKPMNLTVRRLAGSNRALTSQAVSDKTAERNTSQSMLTDPLKSLDTYNVLTASVNPSKVYAVEGNDASWATALVAGNIAARNNGMVVLGAQGVAWARENLNGFKLVRVGEWSTDAWPNEVTPDESPEMLDPRLMGLYVDLGSTTKVAFATDRNFPDALVGAAHAAQRERTLLLVDGVGNGVANEYLDIVKGFTTISGKGGDYFYGGDKVLTPKVASALADGKQ